MYLVTTAGMRMTKAVQGRAEQERGSPEAAGVPGGLVGLLFDAARWWKQRAQQQRRRDARKRLFLVDSLVLGPKQRIVLMRCGKETFLVGTGPEGIQTIVPAGTGVSSLAPQGKADGAQLWG